MQRFTLFTFSTRSQNCQFGDLFKIISPTTFPTVSGIFKNSIQRQLAPRELPRNQALLEIYYGSGGATGHGKDLKIRSTAFLFTLSLPLCFAFWSFSWSLRRDYRQKCQEARKLCLNSPRERTEKTWLWLAASNQNATIITDQILCLSSVRVRQTNNDCAQAYFPSAPLSLFYARRPFLGLQSFLACVNPLSISSSKMATEQHKDMYAMKATALLGWLITGSYEKRAQK